MGAVGGRSKAQLHEHLFSHRHTLLTSNRATPAYTSQLRELGSDSFSLDLEGHEAAIYNCRLRTRRSRLPQVPPSLTAPFLARTLSISSFNFTFELLVGAHGLDDRPSLHHGGSHWNHLRSAHSRPNARSLRSTDTQMETAFRQAVRSQRGVGRRGDLSRKLAKKVRYSRAPTHHLHAVVVRKIGLRLLAKDTGKHPGHLEVFATRCRSHHWSCTECSAGKVTP